MKNKYSKFLAILGIVVLVAMYTSTLVFAFLDHSASLGLLKRPSPVRSLCRYCFMVFIISRLF